MYVKLHVRHCGFIYVPVISRKFITEQATSLQDIWNRLRVFYGFQRSGANILGIANSRIKPDQSHESYWEDVYGIVEDSLLKKKDELTHCGQEVVSDEPFNPTLLNVTVVTWLKGIHASLPDIVKRKYSRELKEVTLYSLREDISSNLTALLSELESKESGISRITSRTLRSGSGSMYGQYGAKTSSTTRNVPVCCLCQAANRQPWDHFFQKCPYLPDNDRRFIQSLRPRVGLIDGVEGDQPDPDPQELLPLVNRVSIGSSPELPVTYNDMNVSILLDYGAETNLASIKAIEELKIPVFRTVQGVRQADGSTPLTVLGESHFVFTYKHHKLIFGCLVVQDLPVRFLGGVPFHTSNDIYARMSNSTVYIGDCCQHRYVSSVPRNIGAVHKLPLAQETIGTEASLKPSLAKILRIECQTTILPGEGLMVPVPSDFRHEHYVAVEPRAQAKSLSNLKTPWLHPTIEEIKDGQVTLRNSSHVPVRVGRHEQVCNIRATNEIDRQNIATTANYDPVDLQSLHKPTSPPSGTYFSDTVLIDPSGQLSHEYREKFRSVLRRYDDVFNPKIGLYNGASGPFSAIVNVGSTLPPQRKGRCPQYSHSDKQILQDKFDDLCENNVFATPDAIGITVEYLNPSFLVKKTDSQGQLRGHRLVTSFGEVAQYCKPQPSLLPNVDDTLRAIGQWRYIIKTDLSSAYFQIPLAQKSMKFCGVCTPFKGVRVYTRCAMGMPGSETALEELMCRILGSLTQSGSVAKIADDLYCGGSTLDDVLNVWDEVLGRLASNGLRLSPSKTVINPASTTILGWLWNNGTISATPHRTSALETCEPPPTVHGLRAFLGAYKFLAKVIPNYCDVLDPLEKIVAGRDTKERISWTDANLAAYEMAQKHLARCKTITIPRREDTIRIVTDASKLGLAATMFIIRNEKTRLAGFFNAKLRPHQTKWLPCELEALCIGSAVKHFAPYITQSQHVASVVTDSRPCVQAYQKLCRGEFSSSARVMTFLSILSNYGVHLSHIKGSDNSTADFSSRNPLECNEQSCQICKFVTELGFSVVRPVTIGDVTAETSIELFTNRKAWLEIQKSCNVLKRVHAHLHEGTRPRKKSMTPLVKDVRRYLGKNIRIADDGLLVVPRSVEVHRERIVIPRDVLHGIATAVHLKLLHPSKHQLTRVMERQFFALNMTAAIDRVHDHCDPCAAIQKVPTSFKEQHTSQPEPDDVIGGSYSADVIRRNRQMILVVRENTSAYTQAALIPDETGVTLRNALLAILANLRSSRGRKVTVRTDAAPGFRSVVRDPLLVQHGVTIVLGREKNINKNPIAEHAVQEIHAQITRLQPAGGAISSVTLALAVSNANSEIRGSGLSSREIWIQRDQITSEQLPMSDRAIIVKRYQQRLNSHKPSAKFKARGKTVARNPDLSVGDLIYLLHERDKTKARDRYIITQINATDKNQCTIQKFVGRQLRARSYIVDINDCQKIKTTVIRDNTLDAQSESDDESQDEDVENDDNNQNRHDQNQIVDSELDDENETEDEHTENEIEVVLEDNERIDGNRGRRRRRVPLRLNDYVMEGDQDYDSESSDN